MSITWCDRRYAVLEALTNASHQVFATQAAHFTIAVTPITNNGPKGRFSHRLGQNCAGDHTGWKDFFDLGVGILDPQEQIPFIDVENLPRGCLG